MHPHDPATATDDLPEQPAQPLRPCPFCGSPVVLDHNHARTGFFVSCTSDACYYGPEPDRDFVTVEEAVQVWQGATPSCVEPAAAPA